MQDNVFGVYQPDEGEEMPITVDWETDCFYHVKVVGAGIEIVIDDDDAEDAQDAFNLCEEDIARELGRYALTR